MGNASSGKRSRTRSGRSTRASRGSTQDHVQQSWPETRQKDQTGSKWLACDPQGELADWRQSSLCGPSLADKLTEPPHDRAWINSQVNMGETLGRGKFGVVKKGVLVGDSDAVVAIKEIKRGGCGYRAHRIEREIRILESARKHRAITELYDVYVTHDKVLMVMEYCEGGDLFDRLNEMGPCSESDAQRHIRSIVEALSFLHNECVPSIIHRDLKPENLLLKTKDPNSELRIADFGLSTVNHTRRKTICGTWAYAAPEVRRTRGIYGTNSDMYSVGIILYEMLCMVHPFDPGYPEYPASDSLMYDRSCRDDFGFYEPEWDNVSRLCLDFICKLIVSDPTKRLSSQQALEHPWLCRIPPVRRLKSKVNKNPLYCNTFSCLEPLRHQVLSVQIGRYKTLLKLPCT